MTNTKDTDKLLRERQFVSISILIYIPLGVLLAICLMALRQEIPQDYRLLRVLAQILVFLSLPVCLWLVWYLLNIRDPGMLTFGYILSSGYILSVGIIFIWAILIAHPQGQKVAEEAVPTYRSQQVR